MIQLSRLLNIPKISPLRNSGSFFSFLLILKTSLHALRRLFPVTLNWKKKHVASNAWYLKSRILNELTQYDGLVIRSVNPLLQEWVWPVWAECASHLHQGVWILTWVWWSAVYSSCPVDSPSAVGHRDLLSLVQVSLSLSLN